jgi:hypothetical protein
VTAAFVVVPFAGLGAAVWLAWGHGLNLADILLAAAFYVITGLGVSVGFHRLLTHRSFTAVPALRVALAIAGSTNFEGDTWSVNSLCHVFGTRPFATRRHDRATNLWPLALISFGESWHNMHHSDPAPGDVLQHGDADQSRPQQGGKGGAPGAASEPPEPPSSAGRAGENDTLRSPARDRHAGKQGPRPAREWSTRSYP